MHHTHRLADLHPRVSAGWSAVSQLAFSVVSEDKSPMLAIDLTLSIRPHPPRREHGLFTGVRHQQRGVALRR
ncbi:MAG: hypothetical protein ACR2NZ_19015 [Rubripirellula sp.]